MRLVSQIKELESSGENAPDEAEVNVSTSESAEKSIKPSASGAQDVQCEQLSNRQQQVYVQGLLICQISNLIKVLQPISIFRLLTMTTLCYTITIMSAQERIILIHPVVLF